MNIVSPKHSFIKFDGTLQDFILPVYDKIDMSFQFMFPVETAFHNQEQLDILIVDLQNNVLFQTTQEVKNICSWVRVTGLWFPMHLVDGPEIPGGIYNNLEEFLALLRTLGLNADGEIFWQCCTDWYDNMQFFYENGSQGLVAFYKGLHQVNLDIPFSSLNLKVGDCFKLGIVVNYYTGDTAYSNVMRRVDDDRFLTMVEYSSNENGYGFMYPQAGVFNKVLLPLHVRSPNYPETRKIYIKSNKDYKLLSANIEKEWELNTEDLPDSMHEKIAVMLAHDNIRFKSSVIDSVVTKKDEYVPDWPQGSQMHPVEQTAQGKCKVLQPFAGKNSNCEKRVICCTPVEMPSFDMPDGVINVPYSFEILLLGRAPFGLFNLSKPAWLNIAITGNKLLFYGTPNTDGNNISVSGSISNCSGSCDVAFSKIIKILPVSIPSISETSNSVVNGKTRTQTFAVGANVLPGNKFQLAVYSHIVIVTAISGDTSVTIASKLAAALNATTPVQWNSAGSAPANGTIGFPPSASSNGNIVTITLNFGNQFAGYASIS